MPVSLEEPPAAAPTIYLEPETASRQLPIEWVATRFECGITTLTPSTGTADSLLPTPNPVRLRVMTAVPGSCWVEFFCAEGHLCGASAG